MKNLKILLLLLFIWPGNAYPKTKHDLRQSWQEIVKYKFSDQDTLHLVEYYVDEMKIISALSRTPLINKKVNKNPSRQACPQSTGLSTAYFKSKFSVFINITQLKLGSR